MAGTVTAADGVFADEQIASAAVALRDAYQVLADRDQVCATRHDAWREAVASRGEANVALAVCRDRLAALIGGCVPDAEEAARAATP